MVVGPLCRSKRLEGGNIRYALSKRRLCSHIVALRTGCLLPERRVFESGDLDAAFLDVAVEAHEQERSPPDMLFEGIEARVVFEEQCEWYASESLLGFVRPRIVAAVDEAYIGYDFAGSAALVEHCGWDSHDVEALLLV